MTNEEKEPFQLQFLQPRLPSSRYVTEHLQLLYLIVCTFSVIFMLPRRNLLSALRHHMEGHTARVPGSLSLQ